MAILLTWNPKEPRWNAMREASIATLSGRSHEDWWGVQSKSVKQGTRVFLLRQGVEPRGIVGSGWAISSPRTRKKLIPGRAKRIIDVSFDLLLDPKKYPPLNWRAFTGNLRRVNWTTQSSG